MAGNSLFLATPGCFGQPRTRSRNIALVVALAEKDVDAALAIPGAADRDQCLGLGRDRRPVPRRANDFSVAEAMRDPCAVFVPCPGASSPIRFETAGAPAVPLKIA
jgi:hypothetical protein